MDSNLTNTLVTNYKTFFKTQFKKEIETPKKFEFPFMVRLKGEKAMLLWASTESERTIWARNFKGMMKSPINH